MDIVLVVFTNAKILILKLITTLIGNRVKEYSCIYQCKDTNFKANHNLENVADDLGFVVFTNAKILILKLITTRCLRRFQRSCCIYQCKDTNFKANHNPCVISTFSVIVVFTNAKILILKLITTITGRVLKPASCIYQCKDTNFKANHNQK